MRLLPLLAAIPLIQAEDCAGSLKSVCLSLGGTSMLSSDDWALVKRIIFVRHAESVDNAAKQGGLFQKVSRIYNSVSEGDPLLSDSGIAQATKLQEWIETDQEDIQYEQVHNILSGNSKNEKILTLTSNLVRAQQTAFIALRHRLETLPAERIRIISLLQEFSKQPFSSNNRSTTKPGETVRSDAGLDEKFFDSFPSSGNVPEDKRLDKFCKFLSSRPERTLIVVGHSIWFKNFWNTFLPKGEAATAGGSLAATLRVHKLANAGVVSFDISVHPEGGCRINPDSALLVHGDIDGQRPAPDKDDENMQKIDDELFE